MKKKTLLPQLTAPVERPHVASALATALGMANSVEPSRIWMVLPPFADDGAE
jgi:Family of unknown function (DUF5840)